MKVSPSFVLALAAASSAACSPVFRRQAGATDSLPTPSAASATRVSSAAASIATGVIPSSSSSASIPDASGTPTESAPPGASSTSTPSAGGATFNDTQILQYALTLEHLEATFYNQSLSKLSSSDFEAAGYNASVRNQIYSIGRDEAAHVDLLTAALGDQAVPACTYNFSSVTDVASFLTTARVLEGVGTSAYLGAAKNISNSTYLETAGSILTVEGRHASYLIAQTNGGGNAIPGAFDTPLDFKQVYSLAAPFIQECPQNASLPITAFPQLTLSGGAANGSFTPGQQIQVQYNATGNASEAYLAVIQGVAGPQFLPLQQNQSQVTLPSNLTGGQMYAVVTSSNEAVTDDNTLAGPAVGYVNIPLPQAPDATNTSSSSAAGAATSTGSSGSTATGAAGAGPTGSASASSAIATATASGSDSIVSTESASRSATATGTQSIVASLASLGSANIPTPSSSA